VVMLRYTPEWAGCVAYNEFALTVVIKNLPPWTNSGPVGRAWTDNDDRLTACWLQRHDVLVNSRIAAEASQAIAQENPFHPVKNYLGTLTWDQTERIDTWLCTYLGVEDSPYTRAIASRWLISAVARIYQPGCQADAVLLLEGPQGTLKSSALRVLVGDQWFSDCVSELGSKDSRLELYGNWVIEIPECDRIKRGDLERVKGFLSTRFDKFRPPYGRHSETFPRSCIFAGSSNDETPFTDPTGNRRFWPVRCARIDLDRLRKDRDQIWAEALVRYRAGAPWWLETPELNAAATEAQNNRYLPGIWDEHILNWCDDPQPRTKRDEDHGPSGDVSWELPFDSTHDAVTVYDVLVHGLGKTLDKFGSGDVIQVVNCLKHNGWTRVPQCRVKGSERRVRLYLRPGVTL
jgi:putative DNA primase/helicase